MNKNICHKLSAFSDLLCRSLFLAWVVGPCWLTFSVGRGGGGILLTSENSRARACVLPSGCSLAFHRLSQLSGKIAEHDQNMVGWAIKSQQTQNEPAHEIMALFDLRKLILQTHMYSHTVGLDV